MRRWAMLAATVALAGCGERDGVEVTDAWVRLPAVPGRPAAAYFQIRAHARPATLVGVETPQAARAEMHSSMASGGMARMAPLSSVPVAADGTERFAPGERHVMLYGLGTGVTAGGTIPLWLTFADQPVPVTVTAKVVGPADPAP